MNEPFPDSTALLAAVAESLHEKKAQELRAYDAREASGITDYIVIAGAMNAPHLKALANTMRLNFKAAAAGGFRKSGTPDSGWIVVDLADVIVHLMTGECRGYYALEELLKDLPSAPLPEPG